MRLPDVDKRPESERSQAAELSDFEVELADLVVPALPEESADFDGDESEDELPDPVDGAEGLVVPELLSELLPESLPELLPESLPESLPELRRESLRESLRESVR